MNKYGVTTPQEKQMATIHKFEDSQIWQLAIAIYKKVYALHTKTSQEKISKTNKDSSI